MKKVTYIWKIKLSGPWTFEKDSDFVQFLTSTDVRIRKYVRLSLELKSIGEFSMVYKKKWVP